MNKAQKYFSLVLISGMSALYGEQEIVDRVNKGAHVIANTVKEGENSLTSIDPLVLQELHAKAAEEKADRAWEEREMAQQVATQIAERKELIKNEIIELQHQVKHTENALHKAQEALYVRESIDPQLGSETFIDKVEEAALATKDMFVHAALKAKNAVVATAGAVTETVKIIPEAAKHLAASTSAKTESIIQDARAKHAQAKAESAFKELDQEELELNNLYKKRDLIQRQLWEIKRQRDLAHESLTEAQRIAAVKNERARLNAIK